MQNFRVNLGGNGKLWAMAKCHTCCHLHIYLMDEIAAGRVNCKSCGHAMDINGAMMESSRVSATPVSETPMNIASFGQR